MDRRLSEHENKNRKCKICEPFASNYHRHFSTAYHRQCSNNLKHKIMHCITCKKSHETNKLTSQNRLVIFMGTSTLYGCILNEKVKPKFHMDITTIAGGTLDILYKNYVHYYSNSSIIQVVIIQALLNDVERLGLEEIFNKMQKFKAYVKSVNKSNKVIFVGPLKPPKLVSFSVNPVIKRNYLETFFFLEAKCAEMTDYDTVFTLKYYGIKLKQSGKSKKYVHIASHWREKNLEFKLHLAENIRVKAFNNLLLCIQKNCL